MTQPTKADLEKELEGVTQERDDLLLEIEKREEYVKAYQDKLPKVGRDPAEIVRALRQPFPGDRIGLLPRGVGQGGSKGNCRECGKYHTLPAIHLDYVGHGAVTERLLEVDPGWQWEPFALDSDGLPLVTVRGAVAQLWIRLTVGGVTRIGVGTADARKDEVTKELIGDAIRNAAMRFGVALDLWVKGDKHEGDEADTPQAPSSTASTPSSPDKVANLKRWAVDQWGLETGKAVWRAVFTEDPSSEEIDSEKAAEILTLLKTTYEAMSQEFES